MLDRPYKHSYSPLKSCTPSTIIAISVICSVLCGGLAKAKVPILPVPKRALSQPPSIDWTTNVVKCLVQGGGYTSIAKQDGAQRFYNQHNGPDDWYSDARLHEFAVAIHISLATQQWPRIRVWKEPRARTQVWFEYMPAMLGYLKQQSRFQFDAVAKYNKMPDGRRIWIGNCRQHAIDNPDDECVSKAWVWSHTDHPLVQHLDLGPFQMNVNVAQAIRPDLTVADLADIETNLCVGALWMKRRAERCANLLIKKVRCRFGNNSLACRCKRFFKATGALSFQGSSTSMTRKNGYAAQVWRCVDSVNEQQPKHDHPPST